MSQPATEQTPELNAALAAVQRGLPTVAKAHTATVPTKAGGSYSYTYADLGDLTDAVLPLLTEHGIAWTCQPRRTPDGNYELVGVLRHESGQMIKGSLPLWGRQAQEIGSAITYGRRYLLGCMTGVVTDDDDDGAQAAQTQHRARAWTGPSTAQSLAKIDETAQRLGKTYEEITANYRRSHGGLSVDDLDRMPAEEAYAMATRIVEYARQIEGETTEDVQ